MKKIEMITTREFNDLEENKFRKRGEKFYCSTKKRSERLIERGLAKLVNEEQVEEVSEEVVQAVARAIVEEATENNKEVEEVVNEIVEESNEE